MAPVRRCGATVSSGLRGRPPNGYALALVRRVLVVGASGAGKSTAARRIAGRLGVPHVELDALQHGPGWTQRATFVADVEAATGGPAWVVDGNYSAVRALLWSRADTVVWLDLPRWLVESRVVRRTLVWLVPRTPCGTATGSAGAPCCTPRTRSGGRGGSTPSTDGGTGRCSTTRPSRT